MSAAAAAPGMDQGAVQLLPPVHNTHSMSRQALLAPTVCCCCRCCRYMPDLLSVKVVGRLPKAKRSKLYHILQDESPKHIYQTGVEVQQS